MTRLDMARKIGWKKLNKNGQICTAPNKTLAGDTVLSAHRLTDILIFLSVFARLGVWFSHETRGNHTPTSSSVSRKTQGRAKTEI